MRSASYVPGELIPYAFVWLDPGITPCCKSRKLQGHEFFAKTRNGKQSPIRIDALALSKSPVGLTLGDEVPHIFTRKPRLRPAECLYACANCLIVGYWFNWPLRS